MQRFQWTPEWICKLPQPYKTIFSATRHAPLRCGQFHTSRDQCNCICSSIWRWPLKPWFDLLMKSVVWNLWTVLVAFRLLIWCVSCSSTCNWQTFRSVFRVRKQFPVHESNCVICEEIWEENAGHKWCAGFSAPAVLVVWLHSVRADAHDLYRYWHLLWIHREKGQHRRWIFGWWQKHASRSRCTFTRSQVR